MSARRPCGAEFLRGSKRPRDGVSLAALRRELICEAVEEPSG